MSTTVEPVRVLYVGGMPRSGTTLLDLMLGELPGHVAVGELFYIWQAGVERDLLCGCGEQFSSCPFWAEVGDVAFGGWDQVDLTRMRELVARVDDTRRMPELLVPWLRPGFRANLAAYTSVMTKLYGAIATVAGVGVVVDSSKRPSLAYVLRRASGIDLAVAHLVRDPRGVVNSWSKKVALPEGAGVRGHLKVKSPWLISRRWVTVNAMIDGLHRLGVRTVGIRYEDLVSDPHRALRRCAGLFGTALDDDALAFVTPEGLVFERSHTVAGGRVRFRPSPMPLRLDESWRTEMPPDRRRFVDRFTRPLRRRYGYR